MKRKPLWRISVVPPWRRRTRWRNGWAICLGKARRVITTWKPGAARSAFTAKTTLVRPRNSGGPSGPAWNSSGRAGWIRDREPSRSGGIRHEDWAESWKRHFKPIEIGRRLLIKPSWSRRRPKPHQQVVVLDPGLSFGTGQHPTTAFCLAEVARLVKNAPARSFLDIGTGSGILAIAAARLNYQPIWAFDFDPEAVRMARANAQTNQVEKKSG